MTAKLPPPPVVTAVPTQRSTAPGAPTSPSQMPPVVPLGKASTEAAQSPEDPSDFVTFEEEQPSTNVPITGAPLPGTQAAVLAALAATSNTAPPRPPEPAWPEMIPPTDVAVGILRGDTDPPPSLVAATQGFVKALTGGQRLVLMGGLESPHAPALLQALAVRWRVACAIQVKSSWTGQVNTKLVDDLFAEVDAQISQMSTALSASDDTSKELLGLLRSDLARDAVSLSEALQSIVAEPEGQEQAKYERKPQARLTKIFEEGDASAPSVGAPRYMYGILVAAVLAAVAYHGTAFLRAKPRSTLTGPVVAAPKGMASASAGKGSPSVIVSHQNRELPPAEVEALRARVEAEGGTLVELGSGHYAVLPGAKPSSPSSENPSDTPSEATRSAP